MYDVSKEDHTSGTICSTALFYPKVVMQFISMNLSGSFDPSSDGYHYALMVICMLAWYIFCIPLKTKTASEVVQAYIDEVCAKFWGSMKILSDNGAEFKNQLLTDVATQLGVEHKVYSPPYHPQSNGRIEGFHNFLKHARLNMYQSLEWVQLVPLACTAYNLYQMSTQRNASFSLCLAETLLFFWINS